MKVGISSKEFYRKVYAQIGDLTPIKADCGKLCDGACCAVTEEITGMYLFPFEEKADIKLNSFHACEPCVLAGLATELLDKVSGEYSEKAELLKDKLNLFKTVDYAVGLPFLAASAA